MDTGTCGIEKATWGVGSLLPFDLEARLSMLCAVQSRLAGLRALGQFVLPLTLTWECWVYRCVPPALSCSCELWGTEFKSVGSSGK